MKRPKIISGGQTGVDQGALDFALDNGFECGGYCPKGRLCELGTIPFKYPVVEIESEEYSERTKMNVKESDATLIIKDHLELNEGTKETIEFCEEYSKPYLIVEVDSTFNAGYPFRRWLVKNKVKVLNVAGNRQSDNNFIRGKAYLLLIKLFDV